MVLGHVRSEQVDVRFERVQFWLKLSYNYVWKGEQLNIRMIYWQKNFKPCVTNSANQESFNHTRLKQANMAVKVYLDQILKIPRCDSL